jgi:dihydroorotate dehydrogenase (NAD+) catalytic subunit
MLYISPPFGNYFTYKNATPIRGTFTYHRRKGLIWHTARSLRPVKGGWRNQIGFRNAGIRSVNFSGQAIYSISAMESAEWNSLLEYIPAYVSLELNLSCPNVSFSPIPPDILAQFVSKYPSLQVKVKPSYNEYLLDRLIDEGVKCIHMSNTISTPMGGISGRQLKEINLHNIERFAKAFNGRLIAGGGIYDAQDVIDYRNAGASDFSISTVYITKPWHIKEIYEQDIKGE